MPEPRTGGEIVTKSAGLPKAVRGEAGRKRLWTRRESNPDLTQTGLFPLIEQGMPWVYHTIGPRARAQVE